MRSPLAILAVLVLPAALWPLALPAQPSALPAETPSLPEGPLVPPAEANAPPAGTALANDTDWQLVYANCAGCHSLRLVTSQRGDRATWLRLIRWMQETQNLWTFAPDVEDRILAYLTRNYAPEGTSRRAQLPAHLLPPRP